MPNEWILQKVRQNLGLKPDDKSEDARIGRMGNHEVLNRVLTWENLPDWGPVIRAIVEGVYQIKLDDRPR